MQWRTTAHLNFSDLLLNGIDVCLVLGVCVLTVFAQFLLLLQLSLRTLQSEQAH